MNRTTTYIVFLLLALGGIVYFLIPSKEERETSYTAEPVTIAIDSASVVKLEIQRPGKSVSIENVGGRWTLTSPVAYAADDNAVKQVLSGMMKFKVGSLISSNPEKQTVFQVDTNGTKLTITDRSGKSTSLVIGKMGPSYSEIYFRLPGSKDVYLGEGIDSWTVNKEVKEWRDKSITNIPSEAMRSLSYTVGNKQFEFNRDSSGWKSGNKDVDPAMIDPALNSLSNLHAEDFGDAVTVINERPMTVKIGAGDETVLHLYPVLPDSAQYYVRKTSSNQIFVISKFTAQQILKPAGFRGASAKPSPVVAENPEPEPVVTEAPKKELPKKELPKKETAKKETPPKPSPVVEQPPAEKEVAKLVDEQTKPLTQEEISKKLIERGMSIGKQAAKNTKVDTSTPAGQDASNPAVSTEKQDSKEEKPQQSTGADDDGELTVHTVARGETMPVIARKYGVTVEQILRWNILKSIAVRPGQELYIYVRK